MKRKKSSALIISAVLGILYGAYLIFYFSSSFTGSSSGAEAVGGVIATAMVTPHMLLVALAAIFNVLAVFTCKRGFALTGAILYTSAAIIFILYGMFLIPMIVLSFIGYARLRSINEHNAAILEQEVR